jgi:hypothetical protein
MGILISIGLSISEILFGVNSGPIDIYCVSFQRSRMLGFVHDHSVSHRPKSVKAASSKHAFFIGHFG